LCAGRVAASQFAGLGYSAEERINTLRMLFKMLGLINLMAL
jgi:hypothetical protein